ncbi:type II secretion system protein GspL [Paraburkholderia sp. CNPSo 3076]|uniref:type II secretion system protein GspL n=1 Tax=Paraburkholderia sp. CNPSo 3076 TaxID=2940936 RepID=UPI00224F04B6|nr:type II secretion system protein GspL [Paraburkholderia sp. CNPSo 3076]MCX5542932.1 type II secretion system protein GspL [Paraburkholderia sp. CNPSo 3076]
MSTLIVLMPPRDPAVHSQEWQLPELPFVLLDKTGNTQRAGRSALGLLPKASATILMIAARDLLTLAATVPPLKGPRLRQALPNVVEDHLIQDAQTCHLALDPKRLADGRQVVAAIDRGWFRYLLEGFTAAGHRNLRAVPVARCLPAAQAVEAVQEVQVTEPAEPAEPTAAPDAAAPATPALEPVTACVLGHVVATAPTLLPGVAPEPAAATAQAALELAIVRGALAEGFAVPAASVAATVIALAGGAPVSGYVLTNLPGEPVSAAARASLAAALPGAQTLTFEALARRALACRFDLCQFEFASQPWRLDRATLRRLRVPIVLVAASLVVAVVGANIQWLMMARQRDAINAQMTELLLNAFPKTTVVLDPAGQMARQLQQLRLAAGEPSPDDFLALSDGLARSLGPVPANAIAALDYHDRRLDVTFKPGVDVDADLVKRLAGNGLAGTVDASTGKWTIRSAS